MGRGASHVGAPQLVPPVLPGRAYVKLLTGAGTYLVVRTPASIGAVIGRTGFRVPTYLALPNGVYQQLNWFYGVEETLTASSLSGMVSTSVNHRGRELRGHANELGYVLLTQ